MKLLAEVLNLYRLHSNPEQLVGYGEQQEKLRNTGKWCELWVVEGEVRTSSGTNDIVDYFVDTNLVYTELNFLPFNPANVEKIIQEIAKYYYHGDTPDTEEEELEMEGAITTFKQLLKQGSWKSYSDGGVEYDYGIIVSEMDPQTATAAFAAAQSEVQDEDDQ